MRKSDTPAMFDRIARRYDLLNRVLSLRRDVAWRRRMAHTLPQGAALHVLDVATGTGDVLIELIKTGRVAWAAGLDPSGGMLTIAREKLTRLNHNAARGVVQADLLHAPFAPASFDAVTVAFGIRNMPDLPGALRALKTLLKPGGRAVILEFAMPSFPGLAGLYTLYFRHVLPRIGGCLSGDASAYRYLNQSVEAFPRGAEMLRLMETAGFTRATAKPLTGGIAVLYVAETDA